MRRSGGGAGHRGRGHPARPCCLCVNWRRASSRCRCGAADRWASPPRGAATIAPGRRALVRGLGALGPAAATRRDMRPARRSRPGCAVPFSRASSSSWSPRRLEAQESAEGYLGDRMPYAAFDRLPATRRLSVPGGEIAVAVAPGSLHVPRPRLLGWIAQSARAVAAYYGRFPAQYTRLLVVPRVGRGVSGGRSPGPIVAPPSGSRSASRRPRRTSRATGCWSTR